MRVCRHKCKPYLGVSKGPPRLTEPPLGPKVDPLMLTEDHQVRAIHIDKALSQTNKGFTQAI